jgi:TolB-like protein
MKLSILGLFISSTFCGCAIFDEKNTSNISDDNLQPSYLSTLMSPSENSTPLESSIIFQQQLKQNLANNNPAENSTNDEIKERNRPISAEKHNINHYTKGIMQDLVTNLQYVNSTTPVAVVSFVMLDSDYNQSNLLGNQIAESLIHEIHKFGIPVIDYQTTGFIRITEVGNFAFSKDYEELGYNFNAKYIFGGTMLKHKEGYLINARVVDLKSKAVVASAQSFIPNNISDALLASPQHKTNNSSILSNNLKVGNIEQSSNSSKPKSETAKNTISLIGN